MKDTDPVAGGGLPDAGGLNIDYGEMLTFEPTDDQLRMVRDDVEAVAERVRRHLTHGFTVTPRIDRTGDGPQGFVIVEFPTGEAIGPGIPITASMFEDAGESDWDGPISTEEIETLGREITMLTVTQWAEMLEREGGAEAMRAS